VFPWEWLGKLSHILQLRFHCAYTSFASRYFTAFFCLRLCKWTEFSFSSILIFYVLRSVDRRPCADSETHLFLSYHFDKQIFPSSRHCRREFEFKSCGSEGKQPPPHCTYLVTSVRISILELNRPFSKPHPSTKPNFIKLKTKPANKLFLSHLFYFPPSIIGKCLTFWQLYLTSIFLI
jgi:hypothetical protein